ncbi:hypothetical protein HYH03_005650 [Edaphochlamys debaryana]|uniref:Phosphodiesterase n=1 Tax=Edaphochlamys debaryana TaxID=47281 RepID=A0A835Y5K7_9CHLO|nr:hypothetical protein HYH03_005650 [Edaphochlamys debaryana]|eukprot:KAG2496426.1 hypothetical protein HYH03_005650 [Edaphochlamys debaryana]
MSPPHSLRSIQLAPSGVVRLLEPLQGNEFEMGFDLFAETDPAIAASVRRGVTQRGLSLDGPLPVRGVQPGDPSTGALIVRVALHIQASGPEETFGRPDPIPASCGEPCQYNASTGTLFWGFAASLIFIDEMGRPEWSTASSPLEILAAQGYRYTLTAPPPDGGPGAGVLVASSGAPGEALALHEPVEAAVKLLDVQWILRVGPQHSTWRPAWYGGVMAAVVIVSALGAVLLFCLLVSRHRNRMMLHMLLPRELRHELSPQQAKELGPRHMDAAETPADVLWALLSTLLAGESPDLRDVILLRTVLGQGRDVYRPLNLGIRLRDAELDSDVADALMQQLGDMGASAFWKKGTYGSESSRRGSRPTLVPSAPRTRRNSTTRAPASLSRVSGDATMPCSRQSTDCGGQRRMSYERSSAAVRCRASMQDALSFLLSDEAVMAMHTSGANVIAGSASPGPMRLPPRPPTPGPGGESGLAFSMEHSSLPTGPQVASFTAFATAATAAAAAGAGALPSVAAVPSAGRGSAMARMARGLFRRPSVGAGSGMGAGVGPQTLDAPDPPTLSMRKSLDLSALASPSNSGCPLGVRGRHNSTPGLLLRLGPQSSLKCAERRISNAAGCRTPDATTSHGEAGPTDTDGDAELYPEADIDALTDTANDSVYQTAGTVANGFAAGVRNGGGGTGSRLQSLTAVGSRRGGALLLLSGAAVAVGGACRSPVPGHACSESRLHALLPGDMAPSLLAPPPPALVDEVETLLATAAAPGCWQFDMFALADASGGHALSALGFYLCVKSGLVDRLGLQPVTLARMLRAVEARYNDNPYHNATHAADVLRSLHVLLHGAQLTVHYLDPLGLLGAYLAAIVHDLDHPGLTGDFLVATSAPLALRYNDRSPLESHHAASLYGMLSERPELDALAPLSREQRGTLRKMVIDLVLATDMKQHFATLAHFKAARRPAKGSDPGLPTLASEKAPPTHGGTGPPSTGAAHSTMAPLPPVPLDESERLLSVQLALKVADVGHLGAELAVHKRWLGVLEEEFFRQGDREKALGLTISPLFDRTKQGVSKSQVGFMDFVALPLVRTLVDAFPGARPLQLCFEANYAVWQGQSQHTDPASAEAPQRPHAVEPHAAQPQPHTAVAPPRPSMGGEVAVALAGKGE